ncbi:YihY/virulence factor BrkB family protein [Halapricum salinum]|uniref:YihY/virulence factor BrkB family protein n=1 Tax=Halapricum salinum TaxID=1457250 RepID=UPI0009AE740A|nr:YihY/virulence factor BrkB family protein [Halapricum salinum]
MQIDRARVERVVRAIVHEARVEKIPFLAGSIAYHAFVSLLPLFALLLYVASGLGNASMEAGLIRLSRAVFTEGAQEVLIAEMRDASRSTGVSVLGIVVLIWGTLRIFRGLDTAFSDIYETEAENTFFDQLTDGVLVLGTFAIAILLAVLVYRVVPTEGALAFVEPVVVVFGLTLVLLPMYYVFPDTDVSVPEILPGAVFAAVGVTTFQAGFRLYVSSGEQNVVGGILLLLTWLYVTGLVILLGVVVNAVLSNRSADVSIRPVIGGISPIDETGRWTKTELQHALSTIDARTTSRTPLGLRIDEETIELPAPQSIEIASEDGLLGSGPESSTLTLRWTPATFDDAADETAGDEADEASEDGGDDAPDDT